MREVALVGNDREVLKIVVVGHVDHGKSTVIGRLLYDTKSLPEGAIEKVKRISKDKGKPFEYAYLLDALEEEQKQGITIDTTQLQFRTKQRDYVIIDAPGHKEFLKNMISGAANAEAALLVIDANEGIQEQSKRHGYLLSLLGIQKVYVLINKMDLIDYSQIAFNAIKSEMNEFLHDLHVYPLKYIPVSAFYGENIAAKSNKMPWYQGESVLQAIDLFEKDKELDKSALRFPIQDVYKFDNRRIIAGRIETGALRIGDEILISPSNKLTRVKSIEAWRQVDRKDVVSAGMSVGITVEDEFFNQRGEFITHPENGAHIADSFKANVFWMGKNSLLPHKEYKLKLVTQEVPCEVYAITKVIDATTLAHNEHAEEIKTNDVAEVIIRTKQPICFDEFKRNHITGRFVLVDGYDVSGGGIVSGIIKDVRTSSRFAKTGVEVEANCFDEYYYTFSEGTVRRFKGTAHTFSLGDVVPAVGDTYEYPASFHVLDVASGLVAQIRNSRLYDITPLRHLLYDALPFIDSAGALIRIETAADFATFVSELQQLSDSQENKQAEFANRWFTFTRYRTIKYLQTAKLRGAEYQI